MASFISQTIIFLTTAGVFTIAGPNVLMFLYFFSNFASTFGNTTVHVMASETYPTELRGTCLGISAFCGKVGALLATIIFSRIGTEAIFWICGCVSAFGAFFTFVFCVDLTHVSLAEHDAQLELFLEGRLESYKGRLNREQHLSRWEIWTGRHGEYDPLWAGKMVHSEKKRMTLQRARKDSGMENDDDGGYEMAGGSSSDAFNGDASG